MYIPDLSPLDGNPRHLAIGWLELGHPFSTGKVDDYVQDKLFDVCANPVIRTRGFHECSFCERFDKIRQFSRRDKMAWLGSGQIRIRGSGRTYDAPNLIYHYVADHNYRPPDEFIEALLRHRNWLRRKLDWLVFNAQ